MGACGCGDTTPMFRMPGPAGVVYGVEVYESCHYCETPAGVVLYRFDEADDNAIFVEGLPEAPFVSYNTEQPTDAQLAIPVVDPRHLAQAMTAHYEESGSYDGDETSREIAEQDTQYVLPDAVHRTLAEWHRIRTEADRDAR